MTVLTLMVFLLNLFVHRLGGDRQVTDFVPYYTTPSLDKGIEALQRMQTWITLHDPTLEAFIQKHCSHLLEPLVGPTPVLIDDLKPLRILAQPTTVSLTSGFRGTIFRPYLDSVTVYAFLDPALEKKRFCRWAQVSTPLVV